MLWQDNRVTAIYDLVVRYDISRLEATAPRNSARGKRPQVMATNDSITLAGKLSNAAALSQVLALARAYAPEGKIQNLVPSVGSIRSCWKFVYRRCRAS